MLEYYQGLDETALETFSAFKKKYPKNTHLADVEFRLAAILYRAEDYSGAQKALRAVLERYPEYDNAKEVKNTLGDALGALGELAEALAAYRENLPEGDERHRRIRREHALHQEGDGIRTPTAANLVV
jgi:TolA-binding protein